MPLHQSPNSITQPMSRVKLPRLHIQPEVVGFWHPESLSVGPTNTFHQLSNVTHPCIHAPLHCWCAPIVVARWSHVPHLVTYITHSFYIYKFNLRGYKLWNIYVWSYKPSSSTNHTMTSQHTWHTIEFFHHPHDCPALSSTLWCKTQFL